MVYMEGQYQIRPYTTYWWAGKLIFSFYI